MIRNQRWKLRVACAALGPTLLLAPAATAQEPPPGDLDAMLANLQKADNKAWQARGAAMQAPATAPGMGLTSWAKMAVEAAEDEAQVERTEVDAKMVYSMEQR